MAEITSSGALSRHITEYLTTDKSVKYYKCKTLQNPDYYKTPTGLYLPTNVLSKVDTVSRSAVSMKLAAANIMSVGIKNTDDAYKFIGLRPDEKQDGTEQFEICPELLEINGKSQTIDLSTRSAISSITTKYGSNLYVQRARQRLRIMMLANDTCESFKMTLRLYLTGLKVEHMEDLDEYWIYNADGKFRFRLGKPYLVDPKDMNPLCNEFWLPYQNAVKHSLVEVAKGEYLYVKEADKGFADVKLPPSFLIDADTVYSSTADGATVSGAQTSFANARATATSAFTSITNYVVGASYLNPSYYVNRLFFYYDVSGLSGTVSAVDEYLYPTTQNESSKSSQKGTQAASLTTSDHNSFTGSEYGHVTSAEGSYNVISYNAQGISDVNGLIGSGTHKTCVREYSHDYLNSAPTNLYRNGVYFTDDTSGTKDPYLYVTTVAGGSLPLKNVFSRPFSGVFR